MSIDILSGFDYDIDIESDTDRGRDQDQPRERLKCRILLPANTIRSSFRTMIVLFPLLLLLFMLPHPINSLDYVFNINMPKDGIANAWDNPTAWLPNGIPGANDTAVLPYLTRVVINNDVSVMNLTAPRNVQLISGTQSSFAQHVLYVTNTVLFITCIDNVAFPFTQNTGTGWPSDNLVKFDKITLQIAQHGVLNVSCPGLNGDNYPLGGSSGNIAPFTVLDVGPSANAGELGLSMPPDSTISIGYGTTFHTSTAPLSSSSSFRPYILQGSLFFANRSQMFIDHASIGSGQNSIFEFNVYSRLVFTGSAEIDAIICQTTQQQFRTTVFPANISPFHPIDTEQITYAYSFSGIDVFNWDTSFMKIQATNQTMIRNGVVPFDAPKQQALDNGTISCTFSAGTFASFKPVLQCGTKICGYGALCINNECTCPLHQQLADPTQFGSACIECPKDGNVQSVRNDMAMTTCAVCNEYNARSDTFTDTCTCAFPTTYVGNVTTIYGNSSIVIGDACNDPCSGKQFDTCLHDTTCGYCFTRNTCMIADPDRGVPAYQWCDVSAQKWMYRDECVDYDTNSTPSNTSAPLCADQFTCGVCTLGSIRLCITGYSSGPSNPNLHCDTYQWGIANTVFPNDTDIGNSSDTGTFHNETTSSSPPLVTAPVVIATTVVAVSAAGGASLLIWILSNTQHVAKQLKLGSVDVSSSAYDIIEEANYPLKYYSIRTPIWIYLLQVSIYPIYALTVIIPFLQILNPLQPIVDYYRIRHTIQHLSFTLHGARLSFDCPLWKYYLHAWIYYLFLFVTLGFWNLFGYYQWEYWCDLQIMVETVPLTKNEQNTRRPEALPPSNTEGEVIYFRAHPSSWTTIKSIGKMICTCGLSWPSGFLSMEREKFNKLRFGAYRYVWHEGIKAEVISKEWKKRNRCCNTSNSIYEYIDTYLLLASFHSSSPTSITPVSDTATTHKSPRLNWYQRLWYTPHYPSDQTMVPSNSKPVQTSLQRTATVMPLSSVSIEEATKESDAAVTSPKSNTSVSPAANTRNDRKPDLAKKPTVVRVNSRGHA